MLKQGDAAPEFATTDHTGATVSLADYTGRRLILWFYPKADTPG
jgi:peroxiredoxin Q/BCP